MLSVIDGSKLIGNPGERADGAAKGSIQPVEEIDAVRFRVYPSRVQQQVLKRWIGAQRYIYNQKVEELEYQLWLKNNAKFSDRFQEPIENHCAWDQTFSKYSESASWLEEIPSFIRRNGCSRFKSAMAKWGKGGRRPQLKTRKSRQGFQEDYRDIAGNFFKKCSPFKSEKRSTCGACMSHGMPQKPAVYGGSIMEAAA